MLICGWLSHQVFYLKNQKVQFLLITLSLFLGGKAQFKDSKTNTKGHVYVRVFHILANTYKVIVMRLNFFDAMGLN
jgi:hypothetical protein